jgi:alkylation response protein AidB-like acyl-CoA dehydrogenase
MNSMQSNVNSGTGATGDDAPVRDQAFYDAFREEVRAFAEKNCPADIRTRVASGAKPIRREYSTWQKILYQHGWAAPGWPKEYGGTGWDLKQRQIFEQETAKADCPAQYHHGLGHIGPVIMEFGTPEQKARYLPRILDGTEWWCQGYSEPGSGSDLASLRTGAVVDADSYVVNGQKIWTSHAHEADMIYMLVRTSTEARRQDGISLLLIPMNTPGIEVRPIRTIDGWHHVNEVFFHDVRVPRANLVGQEGKGWRCAKYLLERERLPPASVARMSRLWQHVANLVETSIKEHRSDRDLSSLRHRLLLAEGDLKGAEEMLLRATDAMMRREPLGARPSALKLHMGEVGQRLMEIAFDAVGPEVATRFLAPDALEDRNAVWAHNYLFSRSRTIAGGTSEVQRNVIAREIFGV